MTLDVPPTKGPVVWLGMDQRELDDAYDQAVYAPNRDQVLGRYEVNSDQARRRLAIRDEKRTGRARPSGSTSS